MSTAMPASASVTVRMSMPSNTPSYSVISAARWAVVRMPVGSCPRLDCQSRMAARVPGPNVPSIAPS